MENNGSANSRLYYLAQERRLAEIQHQRSLVERQLLERCRQLETYHDLQELERKQREERVLGGFRREQDRLLSAEARRLATFPSFRYIEQNVVLDSVLTERTKEYVKSQKEISQNRRFLNSERERLQKERERLRETLMFYDEKSPTPSLTSHAIENGNLLTRLDRTSMVPSRDETAVQGIYPFIEKTAAQIPDDIKKCWSLREDLQEEYERKYKPYRNELGPESYPPWQKESYDLVRGLVNDYVEEFLRRYIPDDDNRQRRHGSNQPPYDDKTVNLISEELMLEVSNELATQVAAEVYQLFGMTQNLANITLMTTAEHAVTGRKTGSQIDDPNYGLVTKAFFLHQRDRTEKRPDVWNHTQALTTKQQTMKDPATVRMRDNLDDKDIAEGVTIIDYNHINPIDVSLPLVARGDNTDKWKHLAEEGYIANEIQYWGNFEPYLFQTVLAKKCRGVTSIRMSHDHKYLAIGTGHGDIIIYGLWTDMWLLARVVTNTEKKPDAVIDISWSIDKTRLVTVNKLGGVQLWSMTPWGSPVERNIVKSLGLTVADESSLPFQLTLLLSLHHDDKDFTFQRGPLCERKVMKGDPFPSLAAFYPDLSLLGIQHTICVSLSTGDILKCNTEEATVLSTNQRARTSRDEPPSQSERSKMPVSFSTRFINKPKESSAENEIGQGVATELLRKHTTSLMLIGYLENCGAMVTVDDKAYVNIWDYRRSQVAGSDWLEPVRRYRLSLHKTMYTTAEDNSQKVIFSERDLKESRTSAKDIDQRRHKAEQTIKSLKLSTPWYIQTLPAQKLKKTIYKPNVLITSSGAHFPIVMRRLTTNQLYSFFTRLYLPTQVEASKFLDCCLNPGASEIIFVLLYPETPSKGAHLSVIVLCLNSMKAKDVRIDLLVSDRDYKDLLEKQCVSVGVTRVHSFLGSDYLLLSVKGRLWGFSLLTGQTVLKTEDRNENSDFSGCSLNSQAWDQPILSKLTVSVGNGEMYIISYAEKHNALTVLNLVDGNEEPSRRKMLASYRRWLNKDLPSPTERWNHHEFVTEDDIHPEVFIRSLCLELLEKVIPDNTPVHNLVKRSYLTIAKKLRDTLKM